MPQTGIDQFVGNADRAERRQSQCADGVCAAVHGEHDFATVIGHNRANGPRLAAFGTFDQIGNVSHPRGSLGSAARINSLARAMARNGVRGVTIRKPLACAGAEGDQPGAEGVGHAGRWRRHQCTACPCGLPEVTARAWSAQRSVSSIAG
jgi:hypothetical protein